VACSSRSYRLVPNSPVPTFSFGSTHPFLSRNQLYRRRLADASFLGGQTHKGRPVTGARRTAYLSNFSHFSSPLLVLSSNSTMPLSDGILSYMGDLHSLEFSNTYRIYESKLKGLRDVRYPDGSIHKVNQHGEDIRVSSQGSRSHENMIDPIAHFLCCAVCQVRFRPH